MSNERPQATSEDVLRLVQRALDEFDSVALDATTRRVVRIANLLGDSFTAIRLGLELKPSGGHPPANAEMTKRLMQDPGNWGERGGLAEQALEQYIDERRRDNDLVVSHSIAELEFWQRERLQSNEITDQQYAEDLANQLNIVELLTRARHNAFTVLCQWERQLTFAVNQDDALAVVRRRVDALIARQNPDVLDRFNVAFRRLREAASRDSEAEADEELSQAVTSCRRILKAVVDTVQPANAARPESEDGHSLTDKHYRNRLFEFLRSRAESSSFRSVLGKDGESLFERFANIDSLSSKGVHARVALDEAEFCALHTYTLAGEVLALTESS